jgi:hypothetical protein
MLFMIAAVVAAGAVLGLVLGRRPRHLPDRRFRLSLLVVAGIVLQAASPAGYALLLASYVLLLLFAVRNVRRPGMGVVLVALVLNAVPIAVNHGMPVRAAALVQVGAVDSGADAAALHLGAKRHLERPSDRLTALGDTIAVPAFHAVMSFGDLVLAAGLGAVAFDIVRRPRRRNRRLEPAAAT